MDVKALRDVIKQLDARQPLTEEFDGPLDESPVWYRSQKEHLLGWLSEYDSPGAYQRKRPGQDARFMYNHLHSAGALIWLAEALGEDEEVLRSAIKRVRAAPSNPASQGAAFRREVPWERVNELITNFGHRHRSLEDIARRLRPVSRHADRRTHRVLARFGLLQRSVDR